MTGKTGAFCLYSESYASLPVLVAGAMIRIQSSEAFPNELREHFEASEPKSFLRSAVLTRQPGARLWGVLGCVLRPVDMRGAPLGPVLHEYPDALLLRDVLEASQCVSFVEALMQPGLNIGGKPVRFEADQHAETVRVGVRNFWMEQAGTVYTFGQKTPQAMAHERLLRQEAPYYPDPYEAAKDWLGLRSHSGQTDQTNGKVVVLVPETRGFVQEFRWVTADLLELQLAGDAVGAESLQVIGAFWSPAGIKQLSSAVAGGRAQLHIARDATRLELFVLGSSGTFYEHHVELLGFGADQSRFLSARSELSQAASLVKAAVLRGEGEEVEFKEWVDIEGPLKENSKLTQVLQSVAAFANTSGGTVFIGVDNHSEIVGINASLEKWAKKTPDAEVARRYVGALRTRVADSLHLPTPVEPAVAEIDGRFVAMLHVSPSRVAVSVGRECVLYSRKGATNAKVPPNEWSAKSDGLPWGT